MPAVIREARPEDMEPLLSMHRALYEDLTGYGLPFSLEPEALRGVLASMLRSGLCLVAVAEEAGVAVGFVTASILRMERKLSLEGGHSLGMIQDIYLCPTQRGAGLGDRLLDHAEAWLAGQGVSFVECQVVEGNPLGGGFFTRRGYGPISTMRGKRLTPAEEHTHVVSSN